MPPGYKVRLLFLWLCFMLTGSRSASVTCPFSNRLTHFLVDQRHALMSSLPSGCVAGSV